MGTNILRNTVGFSAYIQPPPPAVLLPDCNIIAFAGIFQRVQLRGVISFPVFSTHNDSDTVSPSPQLPCHLPRRIHLNWRTFYVDNTALGRFFLRVRPYFRSICFRPFNIIHSSINQDESHIGSVEVTNDGSYSDNSPYACMVNVCVCRFPNVVLRCPTPRLHCFLSSHWPSFMFLSFVAFLISSIHFFFGLPLALFCFCVHFNAILGNVPSAIL